MEEIFTLPGDNDSVADDSMVNDTGLDDSVQDDTGLEDPVSDDPADDSGDGQTASDPDQGDYFKVPGLEDAEEYLEPEIEIFNFGFGRSDVVSASGDPEDEDVTEDDETEKF